jgi:uncharacterized protein YpbB
LHLIGITAQALYVDEQVREVDTKFKQSSVNASEAIRKYNKEKLQVLHDAFITKCGGHIESYIDEVEDKPDTLTMTQKLLVEGKTLKEIVKARVLTEDTIIGHIEKLVERGEKLDLTHVLPSKKIVKEIKDAFKKLKTDKLSPVHSELHGKYSFGIIRLVRASLDTKVVTK